MRTKVRHRHISSPRCNYAHLLIKQPTRSAYFSSGRSWNLGPVRPKASPLSCGAIWKAESMNSSSSWPLGRMRQRKLFSRRACTGQCMKENTRQQPIISQTPIFKSSSTSQFTAPVVLIAADSSQIPRPPEPKKQKSKQQSSSRKKASGSDATASIISQMQSLTVSSEPSSSQTSTTSSTNTTTSPFDSYSALVDEGAELYLWDREKEYFVKQTDGRATIVGSPTNSKTNGYEYWIIARSTEGDDRGRVVLWHKVDADMNQRWSTKVWSLTWNHMNDKGTQTSWCFRFLAQESYAIFQEQFTRALWETLHQVPWSTSKVGHPLVCSEVTTNAVQG